MKEVVAAIDIGGTNTVFGFVERNGFCFPRNSILTTDFPEPESLVKAVSERLLKEAYQNSLKIKGIGIGAPNGNYHNGNIEFAPNLKWKGVVRLSSMFERYFNVTARLTNDANAAALGEMLYGNAKGIKDFIFITLGTGVGSGIVVNGEMVYGHDGLAGEIGHVIIYPGGRKCSCGREGCVETYCSARGLVATYLELTGNDNETNAATKNVEARHIYDMAMKGDPKAQETFRLTGEILGLALANSVAYTSPAAIFLFGGLTHAGELLFAPVRLSFEENLLNIYKNKIKILPSGLDENNAALLGAASLIWNQNI